jgi:hypothetical protein
MTEARTLADGDCDGTRTTTAGGPLDGVDTVAQLRLASEATWLLDSRTFAEALRPLPNCSSAAREAGRALAQALPARRASAATQTAR